MAASVSEIAIVSPFPMEKPKLVKALQGHHLKNYDGMESPMLHTKFRGNRPAGSGEENG